MNIGSDLWHTTAIERLNIPMLTVSDGPNGVRGSRTFNGTPSACLPAATGLGSTWNKELIYQAGELLAGESKAKGVHILLAPTVNIHRSPLGGRGFESFSEDPLLSGYLATHYIKGVEDNGIATTIKHFVCNDQEHDRSAVSSIVTERALREIYLVPFQIAIREANPKGIMTSYNKVNGTHASESFKLLKDILRDEWNFQGMVMSDWWGTYGCSEAINAGLDLEMPGPSVWRKERLVRAVKSKKVTPESLNRRVEKVLELINFSSKSGIKPGTKEQTSNTPQTAKLLRRLAAEAVVLLKNNNNVLPLKKDKKVLVIGPNAKIVTAVSGGGSAALRSYDIVTPYQGIVNKVSENNVEFSLGCYSHKELPLVADYVKTSAGTQGLDLKVYTKPPGSSDRQVVDAITTDRGFVSLNDYYHPEIARSENTYVDFTAKLSVPKSGLYDFGLSVLGTAKLYIDGKLIVDNSKDQVRGYCFFGSGTVEKNGAVELVEGKEYDFLVEFGSCGTSDLTRSDTIDNADGGVNIGMAEHIVPEDSIAIAANLSKKFDQVVVIAGLNKEWEAEAYDRDNMDLPPYTNELIEAVLKANSNSVVVIQSGTPVEMPWVDQASTLVYTSFGGTELGNGLADILFGDFNACGKLPVSFPIKLQDNPSYLNFKSEGGRVLYGEDVYVGYRFYEKMKRDVLFPFGYGLSYTTFDMSNPNASIENQTLQVSVDVTNTGKIEGAQIVQVYVSQHTPSINRPVKELKGFDKVFLKSGETKTVSISIGLKYATSYWDELEDSWIMEKGKYDVIVSDSSVGKPLISTITVLETTYWRGI